MHNDKNLPLAMESYSLPANDKTHTDTNRKADKDKPHYSKSAGKADWADTAGKVVDMVALVELAVLEGWVDPVGQGALVELVLVQEQ